MDCSEKQARGRERWVPAGCGDPCSVCDLEVVLPMTQIWPSEEETARKAETQVALLGIAVWFGDAVEVTEHQGFQ